MRLCFSGKMYTLWIKQGFYIVTVIQLNYVIDDYHGLKIIELNFRIKILYFKYLNLIMDR